MSGKIEEYVLSCNKMVERAGKIVMPVRYAITVLVVQKMMKNY